jgi:hypothetical protein
MDIYSDAGPIEIRRYLGGIQPVDTEELIGACMVLCQRVAELERRVVFLEKHSPVKP